VSITIERVQWIRVAHHMADRKQKELERGAKYIFPENTPIVTFSLQLGPTS
jgi:hypothetical protein